MCECVCVLTEISQAGERGGLQRGVVRESLTGSHGDPLDAVQYQDVVVTLYKTQRSTPWIKRMHLLSSSIVICQLANTFVYQDEHCQFTHCFLDSEDSLISQTVLSAPTVNK